jgi:taurine dioxygenase
MSTVTQHTKVQRDWAVHSVGGLIGVEIRHADLRTPLTPAELDDLHRLIADNGVVIFSDQRLDNASHLGLAKQLGTPRPPASYLASLEADGFPDICVISTDNGFAYTTDQWHSDVTWMPNPSQYSILHMITAPSAGGDTMWSSQLHAYDRLSPALQDFLVPLTAEHRVPSQEGMSSIHPVVCRHPLTGKPSLFVNPVFTKRLCELSQSESDALLAFLYSHAVQPEIVCRWRWSPGDIAIWDNQFVQHYAIADYGQAARKIHRIELEGSTPVRWNQS